MKFKRVLCLLLVFTAVFTVLPLSAYADDELPFTDVPAGHWSYPAVKVMYDGGYMMGVSDTIFGGNTVMTRSMMVTVMAKIAGAELGSGEVSEFPDVADGKYYTAAANWAHQNGLSSGNENGEFMPSAQLTREQAFVMIRALGEYLDYDVTYEDATGLALYHDNASISSYARSAMAWASDYSLVSGDGDFAILPKKKATRAEIASILYRFLDYTNTPPVNPPTVYKVRFIDWNGAELYTHNVEKNGTAVYRVVAPVRASDDTYNYTFIGWDKALSPVTGDVVFTALYQANEIPKPVPVPDSVIPAVRDIRTDVFGSGMTINGSAFQMSPSLFARINDALYNSGGRTVGFYVVDLGTGTTLGYNATYAFRPACTVKAGMALTAYKRAENGWYSLSDTWTYQQKHYCDRSGIIQNTAYGTKYMAVDVLHLMINISDNVAYYMAQDYVGYQAYNDCVTNLGVWHTHWRYDTWGYLAPQELGLIWQKIYRYRYQSAYGWQLFDEFLNAKFNFIKQGLYSKYDVAHKSGWNDNSYNDAAIVFAERPYIMVIMTEPGTGSDNQAYLGKIARLLDEYMSEYTAFLRYNPR